MLFSYTHIHCGVNRNCCFVGVGTGINVAGKLEAGKLQTGDKIIVMPAAEQGLLKSE